MKNLAHINNALTYIPMGIFADFYGNRFTICVIIEKKLVCGRHKDHWQNPTSTFRGGLSFNLGRHKQYRKLMQRLAYVLEYR